MKNHFLFFLILFSFSCNSPVIKENETPKTENTIPPIKKTSLVILGTIQDGGSPHIACKKDCCKDLFLHPDPNRKVVSLGIVDTDEKKTFIFEATPDFPVQMKMLHNATNFSEKETPDAIFITHAHIGHYSGLMYLGKEAMNADRINVYAMPRMRQFLEDNGPWRQLVNINNIQLMPLTSKEPVYLTSALIITPLVVPHRDEYSETVGYVIHGPTKKVLFIPDIDKWEKWEENIVKILHSVDYAFLDGTFYDGAELNNRDMSEIPHPFIVESMGLFNLVPVADRHKVYFIHFNHTNPLLNPESKQYKEVISKGYNIAKIGQVVAL